MRAPCTRQLHSSRIQHRSPRICATFSRSSSNDQVHSARARPRRIARDRRRGGPDRPPPPTRPQDRRPKPVPTCRRMSRRMFAALDANRDGFVTKAEITRTTGAARAKAQRARREARRPFDPPRSSRGSTPITTARSPGRGRSGAQCPRQSRAAAPPSGRAVALRGLFAARRHQQGRHPHPRRVRCIGRPAASVAWSRPECTGAWARACSTRPTPTRTAGCRWPKRSRSRCSISTAPTSTMTAS